MILVTIPSASSTNSPTQVSSGVSRFVAKCLRRCRLALLPRRRVEIGRGHALARLIRGPSAHELDGSTESSGIAADTITVPPGYAE